MGNIKKLLAFSLIELLIVIGIIGILSSMAIPSYQKYLAKAKMTEFFVMADMYKLQLIEKIINNETKERNVASTILAHSNLIEQAEYTNFNDNTKHILKLTANMKNLGIKTVNNTPLIVQFIAEEDQIHDVIKWDCYYNSEYTSIFFKNCQSISTT